MDRNRPTRKNKPYVGRSLSARRAWIEIMDDLDPSKTRRLSLSARRAWIEIAATVFVLLVNGSLSARRAWIEMSRQAVPHLPMARRSPQGERG